MNKTGEFIMSKKFLPVLILLIAGASFLTFRTLGRGDKYDNPKTKNEKILRNVGIVLEQGHYNPKKIDDNFSKEVLKKYVTELDADKYIFLQKDMDLFSKYETKIDNEIHGDEKLESFYTITSTYLARLDEVSQNYKVYLSKPIDFTKDENIVLDGEKRSYSKTEKERDDYNFKRIKYLVLSRYSDLIDENDKKKGTKGYTEKADSTLQREARQQVVKQLDRYYTTLKTHNKPDAMFSDFVNAITSSMDPHTTYFAPVDKRSFDEQLSGTFYGIGAQLREDADGKIKIASLVAGGPAWKSGNLQVEDEIQKIAQGANPPVDVTGYALTDAVKLIRGSQKNTEVRLTLKKPDGGIKVITLLRDEISLEETFAKSAVISDGAKKIGYIYLPEFYANFDHPNGRRCAVDVANEIIKLKTQNVEGIIMDLRGNGGGSLYDVVDMAGLFIEDGPICQVKGRDEKPSVLKDRNKAVLYTGPLAVMVDELSASASEIFAAAIQDYKRGIIIGSTSTYGKGTVQRSISLEPEAESILGGPKSTEGLGDIKLTFRKFYRISGGATQLKGVTPDIVVPDRLEYIKIREKDNPDALKWDEISKADYSIWNPGYNVSDVVTAANNELKNNRIFMRLGEDYKSLNKFNDKNYSLNFAKFRAEQKIIRATSKEIDSLSKLKTDLSISYAVTDKMVTDTSQVEKGKVWLKKLSNDIYIDESVKVVDQMIGKGSLAKAGQGN